jgi:hypothetical protein
LTLIKSRDGRIHQHGRGDTKRSIKRHMNLGEKRPPAPLVRRNGGTDPDASRCNSAKILRVAGDGKGAPRGCVWDAQLSALLEGLIARRVHGDGGAAMWVNWSAAVALVPLPVVTVTSTTPVIEVAPLTVNAAASNGRPT